MFDFLGKLLEQEKRFTVLKRFFKRSCGDLHTVLHTVPDSRTFEKKFRGNRITLTESGGIAES